MPDLGDMVYKIRSKNAGPFWITIDVFCGDTVLFTAVCNQIKTKQVAEIFSVTADRIKRYDIRQLNVVKFSIPRPVVQGDRFDRDMHGAQWAVLLKTVHIDL